MPVKIPEVEEHYVELSEDLEKMDCAGLLDKPWSFKDQDMDQEIMYPNVRWKNTLRGRPDTWKENHWRATHGFTKSGSGIASHNDVYVNSEFLGEIHKNDGYNIINCSDVRVMQFFGPLFNPDKPTQVTKKVANTLFGVITRVRLVEWSHPIHEEVNLQIKQVREGRTKPSTLIVLLYHLYENHQCLSKEEHATWDAVVRSALHSDASSIWEEKSNIFSRLVFSDEDESDEEVPLVKKKSQSGEASRDSRPLPSRATPTRAELVASCSSSVESNRETTEAWKTRIDGCSARHF